MANDPLRQQRAAVVSAESALTRARTAMEAAADREGISHRGIFGETLYVSRSSAERWEQRAREEGIEQGRSELISVIRAMNHGNSPFAHLGNVKSKLARAIVNATETARRGGHEPQAPTGAAKQILDADKKARGEN
jgi:hypothetical protein